MTTGKGSGPRPKLTSWILRAGEDLDKAEASPTSPVDGLKTATNLRTNPGAGLEAEVKTSEADLEEA